MKYKARQLFLILPAILLSISISAFAQNDLSRGAWKLAEINGRVVTKSTAVIDFELGADRFTGNTGCNGMTGTVDIRGRLIEFSTIATTKRMCKMLPGSIPEQTFLQALRDAARFSVDRSTLRLYDRRGRQIARFTRVADEKPLPDSTKLAGRKWSLESVKGRQYYAPIVGVFIRFDEQRASVGGDSGCNLFGGKYRLDGRGSIAITEVMSTMRACIENNKMAYQRDLFEGMRLANRYEIRDGRLYLYRGNQLQLTFREDGV